VKPDTNPVKAAAPSGNTSTQKDQFGFPVKDSFRVEYFSNCGVIRQQQYTKHILTNILLIKISHKSKAPGPGNSAN